MRALPRLALPLAPLLLAACLPLPGGRELSTQAVTGKRGENIVVASDGSYCRVAPATFERLRIGDDHTCIWQVVQGDGSGGTTPDHPPTAPRTPTSGFPPPR